MAHYLINHGIGLLYEGLVWHCPKPTFIGMEGMVTMVVGDPGVGKTYLTISYTENKFPQVLSPNCLALVRNACVMVDGRPISCEIRDTCQHADRPRIITYSNSIDAFLVLFSVMDRASLNSVRTKWHPEITRYCPHASWLLVGCKSDCWEDDVLWEHHCEKNIALVSTNEAQEVADQLGAAGYFECSSLTQENVANLFGHIFRVVMDSRHLKKK